MKGKIDKNGDLFIWRKDKFVKQICSSALLSGTYGKLEKPCGVWCPHFGEVKEVGAEQWLTLCQDETLKFSELIDDR